MRRRVGVRARLREDWQFPSRFLVLAAGLYALPTYVPPVRSAVTQLVVLGVPIASSLYGLAADTDGPVASFADGRFGYTITYGCTGVSAIALLVAAIVAYPSTRRYPIAWRQRASAAVVSVVGLMLLNYLRLGALAWIGVFAPQHFDAAHIYWGQGFTIMAVAFGWLGWVRLVVQREREAGNFDDSFRELWRGVTRFAAAFGPLAVVGAVLGVDRVYGQFVGAVAWLASPFVWGVDLPGSPPLSAALVTYLYASLAAFFALVLATPSAPTHRSLRRFAVLGPALVAAQCIAVLLQLRADGRVGWAVGELLILATSVVLSPLPIALWFAWAERQPRQQRRRHRVSPARSQASVPVTSTHQRVR